MSIGKTYKEAFQKSIRSLENGRHGLGFAKDFHRKSLAELMGMLCRADERTPVHHVRGAAQGRRRRAPLRATHIKPWFIQQMKELVELEERSCKHKGRHLPDDLLVQAKKDGFADRYLSRILGIPEDEIRQRRIALGVVEAWDAVPVSGVEKRPTITPPTTGRTRSTTSDGARRSWFSAAAPTGSARASNSTTAASTPPSPSARRATSPSWSTATRRPSPRTTTPPTSSISSP